MMRKCLPIAIGACCAAFLTLTGCVKRAEKLVVRPNGAVDIKIEIEGDKEDMESGAPTAARKEGWEFNEEHKSDKDDKESIIRRASTTIQPRQSLPDRDSATDARDENLAVRYPTSLTTEERSDGTYFHFRRVYKARPWAFVNYWRQKLIEEPLKQGGDKPLDELAPEKKQELVENIVRFEAVKRLAFAREAAASVTPALPQDVWLRMNEAAMDSLAGVNKDRALALLEGQPGQTIDDDLIGAEIKQMADQIIERIDRALFDSLRNSSVESPSVDAFRKAFEEQARSFSFSEDYGDEAWKVTLVMPGRLVAHNGEAEKEDEGEAVKWEFDGQALYDRDVELLATSVVSGGK